MDDFAVVTSGRRSRAVLGSVAGMALALAALAGCTSRTLPLPPPTIDPISGPNPDGLVLVSGTSQEGAAVGVLNESTGLGVIVTSSEEGCDPSCPFEAQVPAEPDDVLRIWQFFETNSSTERVVP